MKSIIKYVTAIIITLSLICPSSAQEIVKQKTKLYKTWVTLKNNPNTLKGVLYEVKDSSILIVNSLSTIDYLSKNVAVTSINFDDIELLKARRLNSIGKGVLIGSTIGFATGAFYAYTLAEGMGIYTGIIILYSGFPTAILGAGTGALFGSIKDRVPIDSDYDNFNLYRSVLEDYSFVQESPGSNFIFEHKGFVGVDFGPSFPMGDFAQKISIDGYNYSARRGYSSSLIIGYRFSRKFGITISQFSNSYYFNRDYIDSYWSLIGIIVRPMFSIPISSKLYFDFKPSIGYSNVFLVVKDTEIKDGNGVGWELNASFMYNFSNQWGFLVGGGFFSSHQVFNDRSKGDFQTMNLSFGLVYRFSKKSL